MAMPKRSVRTSQISPGENAAALRLVRLATGEEVLEPYAAPRPKNAAAVELGRLGGKKGGPARAAKLSAEKLSEIGKKGAKARWAKKPPTTEQG